MVEKKSKMNLKEFIKRYFNISYSYVYQKSLASVFNEAFKNFKEKKEYECNENKILKIIALEIYHPNDIEMLCGYLSDDFLNTINTEILTLDTIKIQEITKEQIKEQIRKIKFLRNKDKNKLFVIYLLLNALLINFKLRDNILKDNVLSVEKLKIFNEDEVRYIAKKPFLINLIKKTPLKTLETIKNQAINS